MPVEALGPTVGQNLIFALNDLTNAQNNLMSVVLNYYQARMVLYLYLGIMELDDCGMWIERPIEDAEYLTEAQCPLPPNVPQDWLDDADIEPGEIEAGGSEAGRSGAGGSEAGEAKQAATLRRTRGSGALQFADILAPAELPAAGSAESSSQSSEAGPRKKPKRVVLEDHRPAPLRFASDDSAPELPMTLTRDVAPANATAKAGESSHEWTAPRKRKSVADTLPAHAEPAPLILRR